MLEKITIPEGVGRASTTITQGQPPDEELMDGEITDQLESENIDFDLPYFEAVSECRVSKPDNENYVHLQDSQRDFQKYGDMDNLKETDDLLEAREKTFTIQSTCKFSSPKFVRRSFNNDVEFERELIISDY